MKNLKHKQIMMAIRDIICEKFGEQEKIPLFVGEKSEDLKAVLSELDLIGKFEGQDCIVCPISDFEMMLGLTHKQYRFKTVVITEEIKESNNITDDKFVKITSEQIDEYVEARASKEWSGKYTKAIAELVADYDAGHMVVITLPEDAEEKRLLLESIIEYSGRTTFYQSDYDEVLGDDTSTGFSINYWGSGVNVHQDLEEEDEELVIVPFASVQALVQ